MSLWCSEVGGSRKHQARPVDLNCISKQRWGSSARVELYLDPFPEIRTSREYDGFGMSKKSERGHQQSLLSVHQTDHADMLILFSLPRFVVERSLLCRHPSQDGTSLTLMKGAGVESLSIRSRSDSPRSKLGLL